MKPVIETAMSRLPTTLRHKIHERRHGKILRHYARLCVADADAFYSFRPLLQSNSLFFHLPKCAGISLAKAVYGNNAAGHIFVRDALMFFGANRFDAFFKFTVVRDPWDQCCSAFTFLSTGGLNAQDQQWADAHLADCHDINDFIERKLHLPAIRRWWHFRPQMDFLRDPRTGAPGVDFVGRFEQLDETVAVLQDRLGRAVQLPWENKTETRQSAEGMLTAASAQKIARLYKSDIETFGYSMPSIV